MKKALIAVAVLVLVPGALLGLLKGLTLLQRAQDTQVIEQHRKEGLAQLERLRALQKAVENVKPLDADDASLPLGTTSFEQYAKPPPNGAFVDAEQLSEESFAKDFVTTDFTLNEHPFWGRCGAWLTTGKNPDGSPPQFANVIEEELQEFLAVKYVGVLKTVDYVKPQPSGEEKFSPGRWRFDVYVFELADKPRLLGGFRVDGVNDATVKVEFEKKHREYDITTWLKRNLKWRSYEKLHDGLRARSQGVTLNPTTFYKPDE